jgi:hypothetical protein
MKSPDKECTSCCSKETGGGPLANNTRICYPKLWFQTDKGERPLMPRLLLCLVMTAQITTGSISAIILNSPSPWCLMIKWSDRSVDDRHARRSQRHALDLIAIC